MQLDPTVSVLEADDRVLCQDSNHAIYQYASIIFIGAVAVGVPLGVAVLLFREYRRLSAVSQSLKVRVSDAFGISIEEAGPAVHDVTMGSAYGFLVDAFKPQFYMSESVDMLRKLCLVGLVVLFDRGSVVQLLATLCMSSSAFPPLALVLLFSTTGGVGTSIFAYCSKIAAQSS